MDESSFRSPLALTGRFVELVPLSVDHAEPLAALLRGPAIVRTGWIRFGRTGAGAAEAIRAVLAEQAAGRAQAVAICSRTGGRILGATGFGPIDRPNGVVEIGETLFDPAEEGSPAEIEVSRLLLGHAFETERAHRVQFRTDERDLDALRSIERLGAVREATLRDNSLRADGTYRSTAYFAVLEAEWPAARARLDSALERPWNPRPPRAASSYPPAAPDGSVGPGSDRPPVTVLPATSFRDAVELRGRWVRLVPLAASHLAGLIDAGADPAIWEFMRIRHGDSPDAMRRLVEEFLAERARGELLPFVVQVGDPPRTVGTIRYLDIRRRDRAVEIGTWLHPSVWRTPVNTEAKYLLLRHAFETERVHRVQLKADRRNERSQRAIRRLGAVPEGALREHVRLEGGTYRTSEYFSILAPEWPTVRGRLEAWIVRPFGGEGPTLAPLSATPDR